MVVAYFTKKWGKIKQISKADDSVGSPTECVGVSTVNLLGRQIFPSITTKVKPWMHFI